MRKLDFALSSFGNQKNYEFLSQFHTIPYLNELGSVLDMQKNTITFEYGAY